MTRRRISHLQLGVGLKRGMSYIPLSRSASANYTNALKFHAPSLETWIFYTKLRLTLAQWAKESCICWSFYPLLGSSFFTRPEVLIKLHYNGSVNTGGEIVQDLEDLTHPTKNTCRPIAHCDFQSQGDEMLPGGKFYCGASGACLSGEW